MEDRKPRILIVDDDSDILNITEKILNKSYEILTTTSAEFALEMLQSIEVDGIISDINMPEMDGFRFLQEIKKDDRFKNLSIAMLTGVRDREGIEKAISLGVNDYIVKPLDPLLFIKKVDQLFSEKSQYLESSNKFFQVPLAVEGRIRSKIVILSLSEAALLIQTKSSFKRGEIVKLDFDIFQELDMDPYLKVLTSKENEKGDFVSHLGFVGTSEKSRQKLRAWIYKNEVNRKKVS